ncbi:MAG: hypothetical protein EXR97_05055 [Nitrospiraceae bacterium]|nr:hypothetical protein [Nitrospiraceae bacterium]MSR25254.1 hypothetical protein [Nitrospiraceae bacterium]
MALDAEQGKRMLQLLTSRYDDRHWRKKIEKTLSLPVTGVGDGAQREVFLYLKHGLKAYKSRRADPDSWIVGGFATREVIERAKFNPVSVGAAITKNDVAILGVDPGSEVDETWWDEMLVAWFEEPEAEPSSEESSESEDGPPGVAVDAKIHKADA